jgi:hypothetical protein
MDIPRRCDEAEGLFEIVIERRAHLVALIEHDSKPVRGVAELLNHPPNQEIGLAHSLIVGPLLAHIELTHLLRLALRVASRGDPQLHKLVNQRRA